MRSIVAVLALLVSFIAHGAEADDARKAADQILALVHANKFEVLWDAKTSKFYKDKVSKEAFMSNMAFGRAGMGDVKSSKFVNMDFAQKDPVSGYEGSIYLFTYATVYQAREFYERVVVINEGSGFKMSGLMGVPKQ